MMSLIYAEPSRGKTLAAIAACPDAAIATPKAEAVLGPAALYGLDLSDQVTVVSSARDVAAWAKESRGRPRILDDISDIMEREFTVIERSQQYENDYAELNLRWLPLLRRFAEKSTVDSPPMIMTAWAKQPAKIKDIAGDKQLQPGGWAAPGAKMRSTLPGLCTHYLRVAAEEPPTAAWPFAFQTAPTKLWEARCRTPSSVPEAIPMALSALYRAAGYECAPMFPGQADLRSAAVDILSGDDRASMSKELEKVFTGVVASGVLPHAAAYAVTEAKVVLALRDHQKNLTSNILSSFC